MELFEERLLRIQAELRRYERKGRRTSTADGKRLRLEPRSAGILGRM